MQPQLFVTPDICTLMEVLEQFADGMALRRAALWLPAGFEMRSPATWFCSVIRAGSQRVFSVVIPGKPNPAYIQCRGQ
jgi:hypothetical protein